MMLPKDVKPLPMLTEDPKSWDGSSFLSVSQITGSGLNFLLHVAGEMRDLVRTQGGDDRLKHRILGSVFYEASTRTACSFQAAMMRLGGGTMHVDGAAGNTSAAKKGESLEDTIRCLECYTDVTVLRHPTQGQVGHVIAQAQKPVLNAGDGVGEHPTQALLDVFTIHDELRALQEQLPSNTTASSNYHSNVKTSLTVTLLGDLKHGRTVHSLAKLLCSACDGILFDEELVLRYCAPPGLGMPDNITNYIRANMPKVKQEVVTSLSEACRGAHVLYVTRIQKERFASQEEYSQAKGLYVVDAEIMKKAPSQMIVLHPLPRVDEIATEVDSDPRAAYFRQMENGMFVRMALLALVLGKVNAVPAKL
ncbi:hypothetical protein ACA910_010780 [Epithemia clementina (nom. ined.)]